MRFVEAENLKIWYLQWIVLVENKQELTTKTCEEELKCLLKQRNLVNILGVTLTKFKKFLRMIRTKFRSLNTRGQPRRYMELTKRTTIPDQTHLFITLLWLRQHLTDNVLSSFLVSLTSLWIVLSSELWFLWTTRCLKFTGLPTTNLSNYAWNFVILDLMSLQILFLLWIVLKF